jgi:hypothetical protein
MSIVRTAPPSSAKRGQYIENRAGLFKKSVNQVSENIGGRTKARTCDPLIKRHVFLLRSQHPVCKPARFGAIRNQCVTGEMQTA